MSNEGDPGQPEVEQLDQTNQHEEVKQSYLDKLRPYRGPIALALGIAAFIGAGLGTEAFIGNNSGPGLPNETTNPSPSGTSSNPNNAPGCNGLEKYSAPLAGPSIFGQLYTQEGTKQVPFPSEKASDQIMAEACQNPLSLATLQALYTLYDGQVQTPSNIGSMITENLKSIQKSDTLKQQFQNNILNFANILELKQQNSANPFVITEGASVIQATPNGGFEITPASLPQGAADVYVIGVNAQNMNAEERARFDNLNHIFAFTTSGDVVIDLTVSYNYVPKTGQPNQAKAAGVGSTTQAKAAGGSGTNNTVAHGSGSGAQGTSGGGSTREGAPGSNEQTPSTGPTGSTTTTGVFPTTTTTEAAPYVPPSTITTLPPSTTTTTIPYNVYKSPMPTNQVPSAGGNGTSNPFSPETSVYLNTSNLTGVK